MKSQYTRNGSMFRPVDPSAMNLHDKLPPATYSVAFHPEIGFYFNLIEDFTLPPKMYGDTLRNSDRIFSTFLSRDASTGALLTGEKGSGKTMLAKNLALTAIAAGMPAIIVNEPYCGDSFNQFMQSVSQPAMVLFDEFEKTYSDQEKQAQMLTLLDGTYPSKKLFVLTCNNKYRIDSHMRNRPGRLFYSIDFKGLDAAFVEEYCVDQLKNQAHTEGVLRVAGMFNQFNFDMLKALVEEMNRYNETASEAMRILNVRVEGEEDARFTVSLTDPHGTPVAGELSEPIYHQHPLTIRTYYCWVNKKDSKEEVMTAAGELAAPLDFNDLLTFDEDDQTRLMTDLSMFDTMDAYKGEFIFRVKENPNLRIKFSRLRDKNFAIAY